MSCRSSRARNFDVRITALVTRRVALSPQQNWAVERLRITGGSTRRTHKSAAGPGDSLSQELKGVLDVPVVRIQFMGDGQLR